MRITGGEARGRQIAGPEGLKARPTGSKVRQALFNILGGKVKDASVLDLFAGSGIVGLEAMSRGASSLTAVEESPRMCRAIKESLKRLNYEAEVINADVRKALPALGEACFDIVYADPPYRTQLAVVIVKLVDRYRLLAPGGILVVEHVRDFEMPQAEGSLVLFDRRDYGQTSLSMYRAGD